MSGPQKHAKVHIYIYILYIHEFMSFNISRNSSEIDNKSSHSKPCKSVGLSSSSPVESFPLANGFRAKKTSYSIEQMLEIT